MFVIHDLFYELYPKLSIRDQVSLSRVNKNTYKYYRNYIKNTEQLKLLLIYIELYIASIRENSFFVLPNEFDKIDIIAIFIEKLWPNYKEIRVKLTDIKKKKLLKLLLSSYNGIENIYANDCTIFLQNNEYKHLSILDGACVYLAVVGNKIYIEDRFDYETLYTKTICYSINITNITLYIYDDPKLMLKENYEKMYGDDYIIITDKTNIAIEKNGIINPINVHNFHEYAEKKFMGRTGDFDIFILISNNTNIQNILYLITSISCQIRNYLKLWCNNINIIFQSTMKIL